MCAAPPPASPASGDASDRRMFATAGRMSRFSACPADVFSVQGNVVFTDLAAPGGSALWDGEHTIRAVVVGTTGTYNVARTITRSVFNWIQGTAD